MHHQAWQQAADFFALRCGERLPRGGDAAPEGEGWPHAGGSGGGGKPRGGRRRRKGVCLARLRLHGAGPQRRKTPTRPALSKRTLEARHASEIAASRAPFQVQRVKNNVDEARAQREVTAGQNPPPPPLCRARSPSWRPVRPPRLAFPHPSGESIAAA